MKISTKGRYAIRMLLDLAENQKENYISLKEIAQRQGISHKYLEQIVPMLNNADMLQTVRGNQGGYRLTRSPSAYTILEILQVTEGSLSPVTCLENDTNLCERSDNCKTLSLWQGLDQLIKDYLIGITLESLLNNTEPQCAKSKTEQG